MVAQAKEGFRAEMARTQRALNDYQPLMESADPPAALSALQQDLTSVSRAHDDMLANLERAQFDLVQKTFDEAVAARAKEISGTRPT